MSRLVPYLKVALTASLFLGVTACRDHSETAEGAGDHSHHSHRHVHEPPHGGTAVVLGDEAHHLELVLDPVNKVMDAYVLDSEMERFERLRASSLTVRAQVAGAEQVLVFEAVANPATGETVGNTSQFRARADWLGTVTSFDAVLSQIEVGGVIYSNVVFNFPKGNESAH